MRMIELNGWLRLWVVVCAPFWIGAIYTAAQDVPNPDERSRVLKYADYVHEWEVEGCYTCRFPFLPTDEHITESLTEAHANEVADDYKAALMIAGIFPLGLLALGGGIAWVRRGFRQNSKTPEAP